MSSGTLYWYYILYFVAGVLGALVYSMLGGSVGFVY